jgi:hypothetical protein
MNDASLCSRTACGVYDAKLPLKRVYPQLLPPWKAEAAAECLAAKLFYVYTGRNAWHSKWVQKYREGCMHTTRHSAERYAEKNRVQGSVFYIEERPALVFRGRQATLLVTQINCPAPLAGFSAESSSTAAVAVQPHDDLPSPLNAGVPLTDVALAFTPSSRYWRRRPARDNSVMLLIPDGTLGLLADLGPSTLALRKSYSSGPQYMLGWTNQLARCRGEAVLALAAEARGIRERVNPARTNPNHSCLP